MRLAASVLLATSLCSGCASRGDDAAAVQEAIRHNYAAYSGFDEKAYRATTADDYVLLEHGELIDREQDVASMPAPGTGFRRKDEFDFRSVRIEGDLAYAMYFLRSEMHDDAKGDRQREWLESAVLRRVDGAWRLAMTHSTRVASPVGAKDVKSFAIRYTTAWSSQNPASVAAFFSENGTLTINAAAPCVGRAAITEAARGFMRDFPDLAVSMDGLEQDGNRVTYRWTLTGTHAESGRRIKISGTEEWMIGPDGLVAASQGRFDAADYRRQVAEGDF